MDIPAPDSTTKYVDPDSGKPTKDLFNWMRTVSGLLSGMGGGILSPGGLPCFSVTKNANQTGLVNLTTNLVTWQTEIYDIGGYFASNAWTPPAGKVHLNCMVQNSATISDGSNCTVQILKNAAGFKATAVPSWGGANAIAGMAVDDIANGSDVYTVTSFQAGVASPSWTILAGNATWFSGHWISP